VTAAVESLRRDLIWRTRKPVPNLWILRIAVLFLVVGTAKYVDRDSFHQDESILQPAIEVTSVVLGTCIALGAAFYYRTKLAVGWPYFLLLLTLTLALAFSPRSWDPPLSFVRGALLIMVSLSIIVLFRTFGVRPFLLWVLNAYIILIVLGLIVGAIAPTDFPLLLHDPGEEAVRLRLHLLRIHPIALADDCAICLVTSALFRGRRIRFFRFVFATCLLLTVTRASIALGLPLYIVAELAYAGKLRAGLKPSNVIGFLVFVPAMLGVGLLFAYSDWAIINDIRTSFFHLLDATENNSTLNGRTLLWTTLINDLSFDNIYGYGIGGARYYLRTVNPWFGHSHNSVLETVYTAGFAGAAMIAAAVTGALVRLGSNWRSPEQRVLAVALCYTIAAGMMNPSWYETSSLIVISVTCAGVLSANDGLGIAAHRPLGHPTGSKGRLCRPL
jgi:hypothetical protein